MSPPLKYKTPQEQRYKKMIAIVKEVLSDDYWKLSIDKLLIEEDLRERTTKIKCLVQLNEKTFAIEETGKGPIHALFNGLKNNFKKSYLSFKGLSFRDFSIEGDIDHSSRDMSSEVECILSIDSDSNHHPLIYRHKDTSINRAAIAVVLNAVEYYINSERAMKLLRNWAQDARKRNRGDLYEDSTLKMSLLLEGASYSESLLLGADTYED
jgi:hypothetical protein